MVLEGLLTTGNADGTVNIAPMGPVVDETCDKIVLRPFQTSTTYANLQRSGGAVFHVTDDVLLLAQAAVGRIEPFPTTIAAETIVGSVLQDCCRWYELQVRSIDSSAPRATIETVIRKVGHGREWFGFNRARHAVLEAAIMATRVGIRPPDEILRQLVWLKPMVDKTGGARENDAWNLVETVIHQRLKAERP